MPRGEWARKERRENKMKIKKFMQQHPNKILTTEDICKGVGFSSQTILKYMKMFFNKGEVEKPYGNNGFWKWKE